MEYSLKILAPLAFLVLGIVTTTNVRSPLALPFGQSLRAAPKEQSPHPASANTLAATAQATSTAKSWEKAQPVHTLKPLGEAPPMCAGFSIRSQAVTPDNQILAVGVHGSVERLCGGAPSTLTLWNLQTGQKIKTLVEGGAGEALLAEEKYRNQEPDDPNAIVGDIAHDVAFTSDGQTLAAAMSDKTIKLWNGKTGQLIGTLKGHAYAVHAIAITPNNQTLISGSTVEPQNRSTHSYHL